MIEHTQYPSAIRHDASTYSGVSWAAIFAGAAAAAALSLLLLMLGAGLGFSTMSPWAGEGLGAKGLGVSAIIWLAVTQILASGMGGYLAGRLRVKWANLHDDEVYFRDTAHGLLAWAVATLVTVTLVAGSVSGLMGGGIKAGAATASSSALLNTVTDSSDYYIDKLFRDDRPVAVSEDAAHGVATRILARNLSVGPLSVEDHAYLAQLVTQRTDLSRTQAEQRVDQVYGEARQDVDAATNKAKQAADSAAKVAAWSTLWLFIALLIGAFFASLAATFGGRRRDGVHFVESTDYPAHTTTLS
ncbi:hypothetical protein [Pseudomonas gingeri]|uniref:Transmembrane protein n=1 Tax=Pseudomonas gingeri TaxID=117681 RepID=A0A7Y8BVC8_9PSED|nr:hypothetical protein [Pseudomonas gingeri]NWB89191.1 hypothetical protein [Pseudomonas gingeri]